MSKLDELIDLTDQLLGIKHTETGLNQLYAISYQFLAGKTPKKDEILKCLLEKIEGYIQQINLHSHDDENSTSRSELIDTLTWFLLDFLIKTQSQLFAAAPIMQYGKITNQNLIDSRLKIVTALSEIIPLMRENDILKAWQLATEIPLKIANIKVKLIPSLFRIIQDKLLAEFQERFKQILEEDLDYHAELCDFLIRHPLTSTLTHFDPLFKIYFYRSFHNELMLLEIEPFTNKLYKLCLDFSREVQFETNDYLLGEFKYIIANEIKSNRHLSKTVRPLNIKFNSGTGFTFQFSRAGNDGALEHALAKRFINQIDAQQNMMIFSSIFSKNHTGNTLFEFPDRELIKTSIRSFL